MFLPIVLALVVLGIPGIAIASLVIATNLRRQVARLETKVAALEGLLSAPGKAATEAAPEVEDVPAEAAATEEPVQPAAPVPAPRPPTKQTVSLEERLGTQWVVWVGGIALVLGGFFLVRYSIEQGWLGPGTRVVLAAVVAAAAIAAGEWTRRNELQ
jgi:uncharacterized membrane protein